MEVISTPSTSSTHFLEKDLRSLFSEECFRSFSKNRLGIECVERVLITSTPTRYIDTILELRSDGQGWVGSWSILTTKLKYERAYHVVIPVVMDIDTCGINGIVYSNTSKYPTISNIIKSPKDFGDFIFLLFPN